MKITKKQIADLVTAYEALRVNTLGSPSIEALSGRKMKALEEKGLVYVHETIGKVQVYRLTAMGLMHGKAFYAKPEECEGT